jgi:transglutaminase-like putative cysteine protease
VKRIYRHRVFTMRAVCSMIFLLCSSAVFSQKEDIYAQLRKKYSSENAVYVSRKEDATIKIENNSPVIYSTTYEELFILTDQNTEYMDREVYWADFSSIKDLDARSLIPDGDKYKTLKVTNFTRTNEIAEGEFYDDERAYKFSYPGLKNGAREILSYTEKITDPHLFGRFLFKTFAPTEEAEYSVTVPQGVKIRYKLFNVKDSMVDFTTKQSGKNTIYTWIAHNPGKIKNDDDAPDMSYYAPHIVVLLDSYMQNGVEKKVMSDSTAIYGWFYSMVKDVNTTVSPEVKKLVDSITAGATTDVEKVKRIFYWVQDNITYVAYEDSLGGFVPREATLVCSRRFGDCKDMASTLVEMIRAAGLEAYRTWIGTRDIPYTFQDVPSPMATNHMICTYIQDGKPYFLDATGKDAPFSFFTSMIQGKEAFVGMGPDKFEILKVPVMDTDKNEFIDSTHLAINNSEIQGTGYLRAKGYEKIITGERLMNYENKEKQDLLIALLRKGNNKFRVDTSSVDNLNDRDKDLGIRYKFEINDYLQKNDKDVYINMQLEKEYQNDLLQPDREIPREFEYKNINKDVNILDIPKGYTVSSLPANSSYSDPMFGFNINYQLTGNSIIYRSYVYINTLMINPADFDRWNKMIRQLSKAYNATVTLTKQ